MPPPSKPSPAVTSVISPTVNEPPSDKVLPLSVTELFASWVLETAPVPIETAPEVTAKSAVAKEAIPLFVIVASSPEKV